MSQIRSLLEIEAARQAAAHRDDTKLDEMRSALNVMK